MNIYISQSNNIYFNLAFENWLFLQKLQYKKILFLWQNSPCVVIGRAQNPWFECNLESMQKDNIIMVRRQSGGGSVYHDFGNLNYTILSPKKDHNVKDNLNLICKVIQKLGIDVYYNKRNDIVVDHHNYTYKVSGSAFREKKDRAFQHGTLLINANTNKLYNYLHQPIDNSFDTKGVKSLRSKVINLATINPNIKTEDIIKSFLTSFELVKLNSINEESPLENKNIINNEIEYLKNWQWSFGKTLPFSKTYRRESNKIKIKVESGIITDVNNEYNKIDITDKNLKFKKSYDFKFFKTLLDIK